MVVVCQGYAITIRFSNVTVSDQLKAGEIRLIDTTPEEAENAKARLVAARRRDREYRSRNLERERARDREL
jgi:hypothetical protein